MKINGKNDHSKGHTNGNGPTNGTSGHSTDFEYALGPQRKYSLGDIKPLSGIHIKSTTVHNHLVP